MKPVNDYLYAARNRDGALYLHRFPPVRKTRRGIWASPVYMPVEEQWLPELKWINEPVRVSLIVQINDLMKITDGKIIF